jgi:DNA-binding LacI/PurR family transcriptional regulator
MGVDDIPIGAVVTPALTTITADWEGYAQALAQAVRALLEGRALPAPLPTPTHRLVRRDST